MQVSCRKLPPVPVADAHLHFWTPSTFRWLRVVRDDPKHPFHKFAPIARKYMPIQFQEDMKGIEVSEAVYIQANMHAMGGFSAVEEVAMQQGVADAWGVDMAIIGYAPLHRPEEAKEVLQASMRYPGFRGVRFMLDWHPSEERFRQADRGDYMKDPDFLRSMQLLADMGLIFDLQLSQSQLEEGADFVARFPTVQFMLNHAGFPLRGQQDEWRRGMAALATNPNVACKLSAFGTWDEPTFTAEETRTYVQECIQLFGIDRCLFGSNLPVDLIDKPACVRWAEYWDVVQQLALSDQDVAKVFRLNCLKFYKIGDLVKNE